MKTVQGAVEQYDILACEDCEPDQRQDRHIAFMTGYMAGVGAVIEAFSDADAVEDSAEHFLASINRLNRDAQARTEQLLGVKLK
jgi:hypothetical protein